MMKDYFKYKRFSPYKQYCGRDLLFLVFFDILCITVSIFDKNKSTSFFILIFFIVIMTFGIFYSWGFYNAQKKTNKVIDEAISSIKDREIYFGKCIDLLNEEKALIQKYTDNKYTSEIFVLTAEIRNKPEYAGVSNKLLSEEAVTEWKYDNNINHQI